MNGKKSTEINGTAGISMSGLDLQSVRVRKSAEQVCQKHCLAESTAYLE